MQRPGPDYMMVTSQDCEGKITSREWVKITEPDHYDSCGISEVPRYIARFFASTSSFIGLSFFQPEGRDLASLCKQDGGLSIILLFGHERDPADEARARKIFEELGATTMHDYLVPGDQGRDIRWRVEGDVDQITLLYRQVLMEILHFTEDEPLDVSFRDQDPERIAIPLSE